MTSFFFDPSEKTKRNEMGFDIAHTSVTRTIAELHGGYIKKYRGRPCRGFEPELYIVHISLSRMLTLLGGYIKSIDQAVPAKDSNLSFT
jgi:hypothetical protein